ncbi:Uncharacterised protein [Serratia fonticola]|uniref:Uncharacterized protein n=1 Tax=Serratia fonticola TaxID=47917 RepID=A0A4U9W3A1_SERFO|nr:Uncharacterised protein [Serratia fonticola]
MDLAQLGQPGDALLHYQPVTEQAEPFEHDIGARGNQFLPLAFVSLLALVQAKVLAVSVRANVEMLTVVIDGIFVIFTARRKHLRLTVCTIRIQQQDL